MIEATARRLGTVAVVCACALASACGSGPIRRINPPVASIQRVQVEADGMLTLQVRVQNFSTVPMTFGQVRARTTVAGVELGEIAVNVGFAIPAQSADVVDARIAAGAARASLDNARAGTRLDYRLQGTIETTEPEERFEFEHASVLTPVPGMPGQFR